MIEKTKCAGARGLMVVIFVCLLFVSGCSSAGQGLEPKANEALGFDYFSNSWSVIGLKDYARGTRVTPENELIIGEKIKPSRKATVMRDGTVRIRFGRQLTALSRKQTKRLLEGWLPVILLTAEDGQVRYEFMLWATPLPSVKDWKKAFDWPSEGENFLNWIWVKVANTGGEPAEARLKVEQSGAFSKADHPVPSLAKPREFSWSLAGGENSEAVVRIPWTPVKDVSAFAAEEPKVWLERTVDYWKALLARTARIEVPCKKATQALLASHVCQLIANDNGEIRAGEGFYDCFWVRDGAYQVMQYEEAGLAAIARKAMTSFFSHQRSDGRFESHKRQFDANGQALWALWQYYKITADREWLANAYPKMRRAVDWLISARRQTAAEGPFAGVLPSAIADGENLWKGMNHIVGYDFWNLRGLLCTAEAAKVLGKDKEAEELLAEAERYRAAIDAAWERTGVSYFPPSWEKYGTHWGNTETLWPTALFAADDERVSALISEVRERYAGGYVEGTIQWVGLKAEAIHPYMGAYTTMASLIRGEHEKVVEDFYWYLLHSTAANAFPEGILYKSRTAWNDTMPHATGASNYAIMLRHMLVHEQGDELHLLKAVPDWWLGEGKDIRVERAPTHFGPMSLIVRGGKKGVEVKLDAPRRQRPRRIVLHLPRSRPLLGSIKNVEVVTRTEQKKRWDFATVVELYQKEASLKLKVF